MAPTRPTPLTPYSPYSYDIPKSQQSAYKSPQPPQPISTPLPAPRLTIKSQPLTASAFAPYGTVISTQLPSQQHTIPYPPPQGALSVNQGSALRYPSSTSPTNSYHLSPSGVPALPAMSIYSCFPPPLRSTTTPSSPQTGKPIQVFDVRVLERHPYTTQSFIPLASSSSSSSSSSSPSKSHKPSKTIIIVAPTLPPPPVSNPSNGTPYFPQTTSSTSMSSSSSTQGGKQRQSNGMPDLHRLEAFVAEAGQGVMYSAGTWHAPMVVAGGDMRVDFVVNQWMSGREGEDCQEVEIGAGVEGDLGEGGDGERSGLWRKSRL